VSHSAKATAQVIDFLIFSSIALCIFLVLYELYHDIVV
jgi:hypothetical protein